LGDDSLWGEKGDDVLDGAEGADLLNGGGGHDKIDGGEGDDRLLGERGHDELNGGIGNDDLDGGRGDDTLIGGDGDDRLFGGRGDDRLEGGLGDDTFVSSWGNDVVIGGLGFDWLDFQDHTQDLTIGLGDGTITGQKNQSIIFEDIEGLITGRGNDALTGTEQNEWFRSGRGNDTITAGDGNDTLDGGDGSDQLVGGAGFDITTYQGAKAGVIASLMTGGSSGEAQGDTYVDIEHIWGSNFNDVLSGNNGANNIYGFAGKDDISGLDGDDYLYGGAGSDTITGGAGLDSAFFLSWRQSVNEAGITEFYEGGDVFTDFESGKDRIILSRYQFGFGSIKGAAAALTGDQAEWITNGKTMTEKPSLIWDSNARTLSFDPDGSGKMQAVLLGTFQAGATLTLGDIWTA
jgi:Ca2+-binding RTX toxin-like protein